MNQSSEQLTEEEGQAVAELLHRHKDVFSLSEQDLGRTNLVRHHIDTGNAKLLKQQLHCTSQAKHAEIEKHVEHGIVKKSNSLWLSPVVLVTKKDGSQRWCVDYRQVNAVTFDLAPGYWLVCIDPAGSGKATFPTTSGLNEWTVIPFGLVSSPSIFEQVIELIFAGLRFETYFIYLDDIIVHGKIFLEELEHVCSF